jgi:hypothetical protein
MNWSALMAAIRPDSHDRLKHFKNDGPGTRLLALFLEKLPAILAAAGALCAGVYWLVKLLK